MHLQHWTAVRHVRNSFDFISSYLAFYKCINLTETNYIFPFVISSTLKWLLSTNWDYNWRINLFNLHFHMVNLLRHYTLSWIFPLFECDYLYLTYNSNYEHPFLKTSHLEIFRYYNKYLQEIYIPKISF